MISKIISITQSNFSDLHLGVRLLTQSDLQAEIEQFYKDNHITFHGTNVPRPVFSFTEANFPEFVNRALKTNGFDIPTPIQSQVLHPLMHLRVFDCVSSDHALYPIEQLSHCCLWAGVAECAVWTELHFHCPHRIRQDPGLHPPWAGAHQEPTSSSLQ